MTIRDHARNLFEQLKHEDRARVRIALFGQPGAGKSSLINGLTGQPLAKVGVHTDTTTDAAEYAWGQLVLTDLPGYGTERFPKETYVERFQIASFDLFLCVTSNKFTDADGELFRALRAVGKTCIFVRNQADNLWADGRPSEELEREIVHDVHRQLRDETVVVLFTSCRTKAGMDGLSEAIGAHLGAAHAERWARSAKAHSGRLLEQKRAACSRYIALAAGAAAANALNPIPGADIAVDFGILHGLFGTLRDAYGLHDHAVANTGKLLPMVGPVLNRIVEHGTMRGLPLLLRQFVKRSTLKQVSKYIPLVGQAVAASLGFAITMTAGTSYANDCAVVAAALLEHELGARPQ